MTSCRFQVSLLAESLKPFMTVSTGGASILRNFEKGTVADVIVRLISIQWIQL